MSHIKLSNDSATVRLTVAVEPEGDTYELSSGDSIVVELDEQSLPIDLKHSFSGDEHIVSIWPYKGLPKSIQISRVDHTL